MSNENTDLMLLKEKLQTCSYRTRILYFQVVAFRFNSRCKFVLNDRNSFHINNCIWSKNDAKCGPDTCHCSFALNSTKTFFENQMKNSSHYFSIFQLHNINIKEDYTAHYKPLNLEKEENLKDFYLSRVLDSQNIFLWYEMYQKKTMALQFQIKVRELEKEHLIDAVYNVNSKEWHLTDCIRSVKWNMGVDTCHCFNAMEKPWKYLKNTYNFVDVQKMNEKMKLQKIPKYYKD